MQDVAQLILYLAIVIAVVLFFGPIVVLISIIGVVNIGALHIDLSKTGNLGRFLIGAFGFGIWLSVYVPLIMFLERVPPPIVATPTMVVTQPAIANATVLLTPSIATPIGTIVATNSPPALPPLEISAYCKRQGKSPTIVQVNQPVIIGWSWQTATEPYRKDYIDGVSFSLLIDGQTVDTFIASQTLTTEAATFFVRWRLPSRTFSPGSHLVALTSKFSRQVKDGFDSNNDGVLDTFGPGIDTVPPCEIIVR